MMKEHIIKRCSLLREEMKKSGADAFVILTEEDTNWESLFYMSGFRGTSGALLLYRDDEAELILDGRYAAQGREQSPHRTAEQRGDLVGELREKLKKHGAARILCEAEKTYHKSWQKLSDGLGSWEDGGEIIRRLRRRKDAGEIAEIRKAADIGAKAFLEALESVRPGMTEKEFAALLNYRIAASGGESGFDMIVASGPRGALPHGRATDKEIGRGEAVTVDYGARWNGYFCDITRNFSIGEPDGEILERHALITEAHRAGAASLRAGASGAAAHGEAVKIFAAEGLEKYFTHSLGHGLGLEIHESPLLSPRRDDILREGDVVTIEPGLYIEGKGGMRLEDDYLISAEGAERLTKSLNQRFYIA
ncbi:MAG: Xaa-Pro peptidase family protein [Synergistaceae bacterium]|nr:Xaa-Pro peptidase family protein [Synergistaceae bacterium]